MPQIWIEHTKKHLFVRLCHHKIKTIFWTKHYFIYNSCKSVVLCTTLWEDDSHIWRLVHQLFFLKTSLVVGRQDIDACVLEGYLTIYPNWAIKTKLQSQLDMYNWDYI